MRSISTRLGTAIWLLLFILVILLPVQAQGDNTLSRKMYLSGRAINHLSNTGSGIAFQILSDDGVSYRAKGSYDNIKLFGRFDIPGIRSQTDHLGTHFKFLGQIELGNDGSGFPAGTKIKYFMDIAIKNNQATGVYLVGQIPPYIYVDQLGSLNLTMIAQDLNGSISQVSPTYPSTTQKNAPNSIPGVSSEVQSTLNSLNTTMSGASQIFNEALELARRAEAREEKEKRKGDQQLATLLTEADNPNSSLTREDIQLALDVLQKSLLKKKGYFDPEDLFTFVLLKQHQSTKQVPPVSVIDYGIQEILSQYKLSGWRLAALHEFWETYLSSNWTNTDVSTRASLARNFDWYLTMKFTAQQNVVNHSTGALISSEATWHRVVSTIQTQQARMQNQAEFQKQELAAWQALQEAKWAMKEAAKELE